MDRSDMLSPSSLLLRRSWDFLSRDSSASSAKGRKETRGGEGGGGVRETIKL